MLSKVPLVGRLQDFAHWFVFCFFVFVFVFLATDAKERQHWVSRLQICTQHHTEAMGKVRYVLVDAEWRLIGKLDVCLQRSAHLGVALQYKFVKAGCTVWSADIQIQKWMSVASCLSSSYVKLKNASSGAQNTKADKYFNVHGKMCV